jgi:hypothetical protein
VSGAGPHPRRRSHDPEWKFALTLSTRQKREARLRPAVLLVGAEGSNPDLRLCKGRGEAAGQRVETFESSTSEYLSVPMSSRALLRTVLRRIVGPRCDRRRKQVVDLLPCTAAHLGDGRPGLPSGNDASILGR